MIYFNSPFYCGRWFVLFHSFSPTSSVRLRRLAASLNRIVRSYYLSIAVARPALATALRVHQRTAFWARRGRTHRLVWFKSHSEMVSGGGFFEGASFDGPEPFRAVRINVTVPESWRASTFDQSVGVIVVFWSPCTVYPFHGSNAGGEAAVSRRLHRFVGDFLFHVLNRIRIQ